MEGRDGGKAVLAGAGLVADAAAIVALLVVGGAALVWVFALVGAVIGIVVLVRKWGQAVDVVIVLAGVGTLLGTGVVGFAVGQAHSAAVSEKVLASAPTTGGGSGSTAPVIPVTSTVSTTTTSAAIPAQTTTAPTTSRVLTSGSESLFELGGPVDLDDLGDYELDITVGSVDGLNGTQFSLAPPADGEPTLAGCAGIPTSQWRSALDLDDIRDGAVFCVRTAADHLGFLDISGVDMDGREIKYVHSRWTIWE